MSIEGTFQQIRRDLAEGDAGVEARVGKQLELIELRLLQLHRRVQLLEMHWGLKDGQVIDPGKSHGLKRSRWRRAYIPPRPKMMREQGVGQDPPDGDSRCLLMQ